MWNLIVLDPDHCLLLYFLTSVPLETCAFDETINAYVIITTILCADSNHD